MIWQHEWIDWSFIGHILAFFDRSQHIWPTNSLFPERQNRIIPLIAMVTFVRIRLYNGFKDNLQVEIFIGIEILLFRY